MTEYQWDVFISHASEDKGSIARPLAELLEKEGVRVWLDATELCLGDSLRRKIDDGLARSRYGVVVLSPAFFSKEWPQNELNGLFALESTRSKVILPVWHQVDQVVIARYSPLLADRLGISTALGIDRVRDAVLQAVRERPFVTDSSLVKRPTRRRWTVPAASALFLVIIGAVFTLTHNWRVDRFSGVEDPDAQAAAAGLFRHEAVSAGYADSEVLDSWVGDFLFEHWISPQVIGDFLARKSSVRERGDLAIGIWTDPKAAGSVWRIYSGLTTPNVRPTVSSPSLTMKASTIEPTTGPYRDNNGGLSVIGWALVLGVYANSYSTASGWICSNFSPQTVPFIDFRPQNDAFEQMSITPQSSFCPPIKFLAVRKSGTKPAADRFRSLLNLPPFDAGMEAGDAIYISIARENDSHPQPIRVSLLWLKRPSTTTATRDTKVKPSDISSVAERAKKAVVGISWRTKQGSVTTSGFFVDHDHVLTAMPEGVTSLEYVFLFNGSRRSSAQFVMVGDQCLIHIGARVRPAASKTESGVTIPNMPIYSEPQIPQEINPLRFAVTTASLGDVLLLIGFDAEKEQFDWYPAKMTSFSVTTIYYALGSQSRPVFFGGPILNTSGEIIGIQRRAHDVGKRHQAIGEITEQQTVKYGLQSEKAPAELPR